MLLSFKQGCSTLLGIYVISALLLTVSSVPTLAVRERPCHHTHTLAQPSTSHHFTRDPICFPPSVFLSSVWSCFPVSSITVAVVDYREREKLHNTGRRTMSFVYHTSLSTTNIFKWILLPDSIAGSLSMNLCSTPSQSSWQNTNLVVLVLCSMGADRDGPIFFPDFKLRAILLEYSFIASKLHIVMHLPFPVTVKSLCEDLQLALL